MDNKSHARLVPTTTASTPRYDQNKRVSPGHRLITTGLYSSLADPEPLYLPPLWESRTHPEGSAYFVRNSLTRVVTCAFLHDAAALNNLLKWIQVVDDVLCAKQIQLRDTMELYLEPVDEEDFCRYYLVDHAMRTMFWLEDVSTESLGIPLTVSDSHLRIAIEELYWQHVEYFPCHETAGLNLQLNDLIDILSQGQADHLTSRVSTFPYNAQQCKEFIRILQTYQDSHSMSAHARWTIARLWNNVFSSRTIYHHGQEVCRMSIDEGIIDAHPAKRHWLHKSISRLMFGIPDSYSLSFEKLWVDEIVNMQQWQQFASACHSEWKACLLIGLALFTTNIITALSPFGGPFALQRACILLCFGTIISAVVMLMKHWRSPNDTAADAAVFLTHECDNRSGFQFAAVEFSLPRALLVWSLAASTVQTLFAFMGTAQTCFIFALAALLICIYKICTMCTSLARKLGVWWTCWRSESQAGACIV